MSITISLVAPDMVNLIWHSVGKFIQLAVDESNGELTADKIKERLINQEMALATIHDGDKVLSGVTFEMRTFDSGKRVLNICTAGGEAMDAWVPLVDNLADELAIKHGCEDVYIIGRAGWLRTLKQRGYGHVHTVISRKVGV